MPANTLDDFLATYRDTKDPLRAAAAATVAALAGGAITLRDRIALGALGGSFAGLRGEANAAGDQQKDLDVLADEIFFSAVRAAPVALYASEELDHPVVLGKRAPLALAVDPLDGSSNIDTNVSIGTIFSILPVVGDPETDTLKSFLQPGRNQLAAGFFVYGPQLSLVLSLDAGTTVFVYSQRDGQFVQTHANLVLPATTQEFAVNAANHRYWDDAMRSYIDDCLKGSEGPRGRDFNMRWVASLVADTYRILIRSGVYLYPGDSRKGYSRGRLRLVYEANPIAMVIEQAGGQATDTAGSILDLIPKTLHERVPLVFGSAAEVEEIGRYHARP